VESVEGGAPAQRAGLKAGDLITAIDGKHVSGSIDLVVAIRTHVPGDTVALTVRRADGTHTVTVRLNAKTG
jgi:putative serine protease PepD